MQNNVDWWETEFAWVWDAGVSVEGFGEEREEGEWERGRRVKESGGGGEGGREG